MLKGKFYREKDVERFSAELPAVSPECRRIIGLDFGTNCGVTVADIVPGTKECSFIAGQWDLSAGAYDTGVIRLLRLRAFLLACAPHLVSYEEVKNTPAGMKGASAAAIMARAATSAEFLGSLKSVVATFCGERGIPTQGYPIGTIKKYATGVGNAGKPEMIRAANKKFGLELPEADYEKTGVDNICDSLFCCEMAVRDYGDAL